MKLSEWAKLQGVTYKTAWRWHKAGILPVSVQQLANGTIIVQESPNRSLSVAIYARVSSSDQKTDLDRQIARLLVFANEKGLSISRTVSEIGSGLNGHRISMRQ